MTAQETAKIIFVLRATYPSAYKSMTTKDFDNLIASWTVLFSGYSYEAVSAGLNACILANATQFPPSPGMIIDQIANQADNGPEALEAWTLVKKALRNGINGSEEEYAKLPPLVQKALGSHATLIEWAKLEDETSKNVAQSQFVSQYKAVCIRAKEDAKIPENVKQTIRTNLPETMKPKQIEDHQYDSLPMLDAEPEYELPFVEVTDSPFDPERKNIYVETFLEHKGVKHLRDLFEQVS